MNAAHLVVCMLPKTSSNLFQAHQNNLNAKTKAMIIEVNFAIGTSICVDTEDILVVTGVAGMFTQGNMVKQMRRVHCHH